MTNTTCVDSPVAYLIGDEHQRLALFHEFYGPSPKIMITAESLIYDYMIRLCPAYCGGSWDFYRVSNSCFYMVPLCLESKSCLVSWPNNHFEGALSAEAAGITACLFAFQQLASLTGNNRHIENYYNLLEFAMNHPESAIISRIID